jgi:hypothetical protein
VEGAQGGGSNYSHEEGMGVGGRAGPRLQTPTAIPLRRPAGRVSPSRGPGVHARGLPTRCWVTLSDSLSLFGLFVRAVPTAQCCRVRAECGSRRGSRGCSSFSWLLPDG